MPALARGQENQPSIVNWFLTVNGVLTDAYNVGFRIFDITAGLPGTQVFPAIPGSWEDATTAPGRFGVGSYYAYDNAAAKGWTPPIAEPVGTHRIEWRWKIYSAAPYQSGQEDFEVLVESGGGSADTYCSVADIRAEGITSAMASDAKVLAYIEAWQQFLDQACGQWFNARSMTLALDGTQSDTLHFAVPIISVEWLRLNDSPDNLDASLYRVYNARRYPDDRRNPRIKLISPHDGDIWTVCGLERMAFRKGRQNQQVKGIFGWTEDDGSTPKLIKRALTKLVVEKLMSPIYGGADPAPGPPATGNKIEEETDGHRVRWESSGQSVADKSYGLSGITNDLEVLDIIRMYRRPIGAASPAQWSLY